VARGTFCATMTTDSDDGVLTAQEVAHLDVQGAEIVAHRAKRSPDELGVSGEAIACSRSAEGAEKARCHDSHDRVSIDGAGDLPTRRR